MQEALTKLNGLVGYLQQRVSYYEKLVKETNARAEKLDNHEEELVVKANDLLAREAKIKDVEDVATMSKQAVKDKQEADILLKSVKKERDDFNKLLASDNEALGKERAQIAIDRQKADNTLIMIQKEWGSLKKEQATWKEKFIEEIKNKVR